MYIRVLYTIIYQSDDLALSASDTCAVLKIHVRKGFGTEHEDSFCIYPPKVVFRDRPRISYAIGGHAEDFILRQSKYDTSKARSQGKGKAQFCFLSFRDTINGPTYVYFLHGNRAYSQLSFDAASRSSTADCVNDATSPEPGAFNPDKWLNASSEMHRDWLPFGKGAHGSPVRNLALTEFLLKEGRL